MNKIITLNKYNLEIGVLFPPFKLCPQLGLFHEIKIVSKYCQSIPCLKIVLFLQYCNVNMLNKNNFQIGLYVKATFNI